MTRAAATQRSGLTGQRTDGIQLRFAHHAGQSASIVIGNALAFYVSHPLAPPIKAYVVEGIRRKTTLLGGLTHVLMTRPSKSRCLVALTLIVPQLYARLKRQRDGAPRH